MTLEPNNLSDFKRVSLVDIKQPELYDYNILCNVNHQLSY